MAYKIVWDENGDPKVDINGAVKTLGELDKTQLKALATAGKNREGAEGRIMQHLACAGLWQKGVRLRTSV